MEKMILSNVANLVFVMQKHSGWFKSFGIDLTYRLGCSDECRKTTMLEF